MGLRFPLLIAAFLAVTFALPAAADEMDMPVVKITRLDGSMFDLAALKGKVVIVHFWATWCGPCREEMPVLEAYYKSHKPQGLEVIAISVDKARNREAVINYMHDFHFPVALISDAETNSFNMPSAIPITYVVDRHGQLRLSLSPDWVELSTQNLDAVVLPLLASKK